MISILYQSQQHVERRLVWPASWPTAVTSVAAAPAGFARGFDELEQRDWSATARALSALIGLVQSGGDDLATLLLMCVFQPAIRKAARCYGVDVNEVAGELVVLVGGFQLEKNAVPTASAIAKDLRKRLQRRAARDQRRHALMLLLTVPESNEEMTAVETRVDLAALVEQLDLDQDDRELLVRQLDGQSVLECAAELGVAPTTMYRRRARLQQRLAVGV